MFPANLSIVTIPVEWGRGYCLVGNLPLQLKPEVKCIHDDCLLNLPLAKFLQVGLAAIATIAAIDNK